MALSLSPPTRPTLAASNREFLVSSVLKNCIEQVSLFQQPARI